ncbi:hypothetical protein AB6A40_001460 [Gnathostoma spinigerum]|uniref:SGNH hydrolase-type esterase domain-containing protein n=1 Tax=Gnathostoma spinigerum TaxID=75299 RepID=A0ABD6E5H7_9BILA
MDSLARKDTFGDHRWDDLHNWFTSEAKVKEAEVLFLGDDHIALLEQMLIYRENFAPLHCLCFGAFGDRICDLQWRLDQGYIAGLTPRVIVVSIGNCDVGQDECIILDGINKIAETIKKSNPTSRLFFLKLLPTGREPNPRRDFVNAVNNKLEEYLKNLADVIDIDPSIQGTNGKIDVHDMFDYVHLTQEGYRKIFEPVLVAVASAINPENTS